MTEYRKIETNRKHLGNWLIKEEYGRIYECRCSICNKDPLDYIYGTEDWWLGQLPNYCPNCGERMIQATLKFKFK